LNHSTKHLRYGLYRKAGPLKVRGRDLFCYETSPTSLISYAIGLLLELISPKEGEKQSMKGPREDKTSIQLGQLRPNLSITADADVTVTKRFRVGGPRSLRACQHG